VQAHAEFCSEELSPGWSKKARAWAEYWNQRSPLFTHGNTMSIWAAVKTTLRADRPTSKSKSFASNAVLKKSHRDFDLEP